MSLLVRGQNDMSMRGTALNIWRNWGTGRSSSKAKRQTRRRLTVSGRLEALEARELLTVSYNGGGVLPNVQAQAVYLGSQWANSSMSSQITQTDQFLSTIVNSPYMDMLTNAGYNVGRGTDTKGVVDNISISTRGSLSDNQIQSDLASLISQGKVQSPGSNNLYMVYVEPGVAVTMGGTSSTNYFLGYHGAFQDGSNVVHYAVMPYPGSPNPSSLSQGFSSTFNEETAVSSHELAEAVTDPNVSLNQIGWYDFQNNGEIADLANGQTSTITGPNGTYVVSDVVNQNDQVITPSSSSSGGGSSGGGTGGGSTGGGTTSTLSAPNVTATAVSSTVAGLTWNSVSGAQGYQVYLVVGGQDEYLGAVSASTTSVHVTGLAAGSTDSFMVAAYNSTSTADSSVATVTLPTPVVPASVTAPVVTATALSSTSVQLTWNAESQATGFGIYWSNGYNVVFLGTVSGTSTSVTVTGLSPGSGSYFLVEAFNNTSRADSQWVLVTTPSTASTGSFGFFTQYAEQGFGSSSFGNSSPSMGSAASDYHGGRERW